MGLLKHETHAGTHAGGEWVVGLDDGRVASKAAVREAVLKKCDLLDRTQFRDRFLEEHLRMLVDMMRATLAGTYTQLTATNPLGEASRSRQRSLGVLANADDADLRVEGRWSVGEPECCGKVFALPGGGLVVDRDGLHPGGSLVKRSVKSNLGRRPPWKTAVTAFALPSTRRHADDTFQWKVSSHEDCLLWFRAYPKTV